MFGDHFMLMSGHQSPEQWCLVAVVFVCIAVVAERDALALSKSPFVVQLFYSLQSKYSIFLVSANCFYLITIMIKDMITVN